MALFREVGDKKGLANALNQLGTVTWSESDLAQAIVHYAEGLAIGRELGDKILIAMTLSGLGDVALYQGDEQRATALYQESLVLSRQESKQSIACSLVGLTGVAGAVGQPKRAARLLSAVETLLDAIGLSVSVWPEMRADYDRYIAAARAQLDEATWAAAGAEGRAMTLEQAIAYALNATSPAPPR